MNPKQIAARLVRMSRGESLLFDASRKEIIGALVFLYNSLRRKASLIIETADKGRIRVRRIEL